MGLAYERVGSGPPLVLLHGIGHHRQAWQAVTPLLAPSRELILVDLPGHGESPPLDQASIARQRLPQARFVSLPGCGHVPMTDDPDLVARVLLEGSAAPAGVPLPRAAATEASRNAGELRGHALLAACRCRRCSPRTAVVMLVIRWQVRGLPGGCLFQRDSGDLTLRAQTVDFLCPVMRSCTMIALAARPVSR